MWFVMWWKKKCWIILVQVEFELGFGKQMKTSCKIFILSLYIQISFCVTSFLSVGVYVLGHTGTQTKRLEEASGGSLALFFACSFETRPFSLFRVPIFASRLKMNKPRTSLCLCLPQNRAYICVGPWLPPWVLGSELLLPWLYCNYFYLLSNLSRSLGCLWSPGPSFGLHESQFLYFWQNDPPLKFTIYYYGRWYVG